MMLLKNCETSINRTYKKKDDTNHAIFGTEYGGNYGLKFICGIDIYVPSYVMNVQLHTNLISYLPNWVLE